MLIAAFFSWWYGAGFRGRIAKTKMSFVKVNDQFSIGLLLKTLFQPFRQISAGGADGAIEDKMRALGDNLISRLIGAFVRFFVILAGLFVFAGLAVISLIVIVLWLLAPVLPILGIILLIAISNMRFM